jgi:hypothetical protein
VAGFSRTEAQCHAALAIYSWVLAIDSSATYPPACFFGGAVFEVFEVLFLEVLLWWF